MTREDSAEEVLKRLNDAFEGKLVPIPSSIEINNAVEILRPIVGIQASSITTGSNGVREVSKETAQAMNELADLAHKIRKAEECAAELLASLPDSIASRIPAAARRF